MILSGEYAVLHGAPALAVAIKRHAQILITSRSEPPCILESSLFHEHAIPFHVDPGGIEEQQDSLLAKNLPLVYEIFNQVMPKFHNGRWNASPFRMVLDTRDFFGEKNLSHLKIGLGSSAALLVAMTAACKCYFAAEDHEPCHKISWPEIWTVHQNIPGQHGSGLDVASSYHGQLISFQKMPDNSYPTVRFVKWPTSLHLGMVWTGRSTETGAMLKLLAKWRESHPRLFQSAIDRLTDAALQSATLADQGQTSLLIQSFRLYGEALNSLSRASGINIISREHQEIEARATKMGLVYKSSGAGGGDIGFAATEDLDLLKRFQHTIEAMGYHVMPVPIDPSGLTVKRQTE